MRRLRIAGVLIAAGLTVAASAEAEQVAPREYVVVYKAGASARRRPPGDRPGGRDDRRGERGDRRGHGAFGRRELRGRGREPTGARGRGLQHADRPGAARRSAEPPRGDRAAVEARAARAAVHARPRKPRRRSGRRPPRAIAVGHADDQRDADGSYAVSPAHDVLVGIIDTGVDGPTPTSRRTSTGAEPQLHRGRPDRSTAPARRSPTARARPRRRRRERARHPRGRHLGAALNGIGIARRGAGRELVNLRAGQDSGFFFLGRRSTPSPTPATTVSTSST